MVDRVNGAHVPELTKKTLQHSQSLAPPTHAEPPKEQAADTKEVLYALMASLAHVFMSKQRHSYVHVLTLVK